MPHSGTRVTGRSWGQARSKERQLRWAQHPSLPAQPTHPRKKLENCLGLGRTPTQEQPGEQMCARLSPRPCAQSTDYAFFPVQSGEGPWPSAIRTPQNSRLAT